MDELLWLRVVAARLAAQLASGPPMPAYRPTPPIVKPVQHVATLARRALRPAPQQQRVLRFLRRAAPTPVTAHHIGAVLGMTTASAHSVLVALRQRRDVAIVTAIGPRRPGAHGPRPIAYCLVA